MFQFESKLRFFQNDVVSCDLFHTLLLMKYVKTFLEIMKIYLSRNYFQAFKKLIKFTGKYEN